jgi:hypothetical protein
MSESIAGDGFIDLGERGTTKTAIDEKFRSLSKKQAGKAGVNQIGRLLTNAVNTNEDLAFRAKEKL